MRVLTVTVDDQLLGDGHEWHSIIDAHPDDSRFPLVCARCLMRHDNPQAFGPCDALGRDDNEKEGQ